MEFNRTRVFQLGLLLVVFGVLATWLWAPRPAVNLPRLTRDELAALTDSDSDRRQILIHLTARLLRKGSELEAWQSLPSEAQPVWTTLCIEIDLTTGDQMRTLIRRQNRKQANAKPTLSDAADGFEVMDCKAMADCLRSAEGFIEAETPEKKWVPAFYARFQPLLPAARTARLAYQQAHIDALMP